MTDPALAAALDDIRQLDDREELLLIVLAGIRRHRLGKQREVTRIISEREQRAPALSAAGWRAFFGNRKGEISRALAFASLAAPED